MNCFKLAFALLAGASVVAAATYPRLHFRYPYVEPMDPFLSEAELVRLTDILWAGDNNAALAYQFGKRQLKLSTSFRIYRLMSFAVEHGRVGSFEYLLSRLEHEPQAGWAMGGLLREAISRDQMAIAGLIVKNGFLPLRTDTRGLWVRNVDGSWHLNFIKQLITDHAEQAAELAPARGDFMLLNTIHDALALLEIARHCAARSGQQLNLTEFMEHFIAEAAMFGADKALLTRHLLREGAQVRPEFLYGPKLQSPYLECIRYILLEWATRMTAEEAEHMHD